MSEMEGRHVVITGAGGALGSAVVEVFQRAGAILHTPRHREMNAADEAQVASYYTRISGLWASIHLAGGFRMAPVGDTALADFRGQFEINTVTCFLCCREAVWAMRRGEQGGRIVNVTARAGVVPVGGMIAYTTSKAAVASLTQCLAEELRDEKIFVNAVAPSIIDTPANRQAMPDADHSQWPKAEEIAATLLELASPSSTRTGLIVPVYGRV
jgi:NAD(P)-dependent dehydrogenase (short-subunit alcohol dehydrogenase family)